MAGKFLSYPVMSVVMAGGWGAVYDDIVLVFRHPRDPSKYGRHNILEGPRGVTESKRDPTVMEYPNVGDEWRDVPAIRM